jgi:hypothetical protein
MNGLIDLKITSMNFPLEILAATIFAIAVSTYMILDLVDYIKSKITMAHSSPEGIKLSKGSRLVSAQLSINGKSVASTEKRSKKYSTEEVVSLLESLIEHPSKPGYKRHDIISKIHEIKNAPAAIGDHDRHADGRPCSLWTRLPSRIQNNSNPGRSAVRMGNQNTSRTQTNAHPGAEESGSTRVTTGVPSVDAVPTSQTSRAHVLRREPVW